jgi:hypothetical protein
MGFLLANFIRRTYVGGVSYFNLTRSKNGKKKDGHWFIDGERVYISCPFCGAFYDISTHGVRSDGVVTPCVVCLHERGGCGRYLHVILKKWDLGYREEKTFFY